MTAAISMGGQIKEDKAAAPPANAEGRNRARPLVHIQVWKIQEEDLRVGVGAGEGIKARDMRLPITIHAAAARVDAVVFFRSAARPSSPLGKMRAAIEFASYGDNVDQDRDRTSVWF